MRRNIAVAAIVLLLVPVASANAGDRGEPGRHRWLGMTAGLVTGMLLGGYLSAEVAADSDSPAAFFALWTAAAVGGAAGGYALAGGFSDRVDNALNDGRRAVRDARAQQLGEAPGAAVALPELRLSSLAGFAPPTGAADPRATVSHVRAALAMTGSPAQGAP